MALYRYKAVTAAGEPVEGEMEAADEKTVVARLHDLGHIPVRAEPLVGGRETVRARGGARRTGRVSSGGAGVVARELATLLKAGLPLERALEILVELGETESMRTLLAGVLDRVRGGASLADAFAQGTAFPVYFVSMVRAGEAGGALDAVLAQLAEYMERSRVAAETVKSALIYPIILLFTAGVSIVILMTVVVPQFKPLFEDAGQALPFATRIVIGAADAFRDYWAFMLGGIAALVLLVKLRLRDPGSRLAWDRMLLRLPLAGELILKTEVGRFGRTLGTLLHNGVMLLNAMAIVREVHTNTFVAAFVGDLAEQVRQGQGLAKPLAEGGLFPTLAVHLVRVGEESGRLDEILLRIADIFDREVQRTMDRLLALLVPVLTIGLGVIIAAIIGSVLVAILSINKLAI
jgi:general secretion pathway protein F